MSDAASPPDFMDLIFATDISHALDLWNPFVWVTTVRRGDREDGEVVAEFEMGLARRRARLALRGQDDMLVNVVKKAALWG